MQAAYSRKDFQLIGQLLVAQKPEQARDLYAVCRTQPHETDLTRIPILFHLFCQIKQVSPDTFIPDTYPPGKCPGKNMRRLFASVILHLYKPEVFTMQAAMFSITGGVCITLMSIFNYKSRGKVSEIIDEAVAWEKAYDDYRAEVERIVELLKEM